MRKSIFILFLFNFFINTLVNGQEYKLIIHHDTNVENRTIKSFDNFIGDSLSIQNHLKLFLFDLQNDGYLASSIDSLRFDSIYVHAYLFIGKKYYWNNLDFSDLEPELIQSRNFKNKKGKTVKLSEFQALKNEIISYYENSGYPFVYVQLNPFEINDSIISAFIHVDRGKYYKLDSILIKGSAKISPVFIKKTLGIHSGMAFNQKRLNLVDKKIRDLNFLSEIKPAELEFRQNAVDLYLYLENKKANLFNGLIGFLPANEKTGKMLITGELNLHLVNSFGKAEEVFLDWEKLESTTQKLNLGFAYPYILKSNLGFDADFELYKKDSTFLSLKAGFGIRLFLNGPDYIKGYYRYKSSTRIGNDQVIFSSANYADVKSNITGVQYFINSLDYRLNPRKGIEVNIYGGAGFKELVDANISTDSLNIDTKTVEVEAGLDFDIFYPIYSNFVFHFGNTTRYLDQFADKGKENLLFENELYRFGGAKSLRGFDESIFYASIYSLQNIEIKYLFEQNSSFYLFWNGAYYYKNVSETVTEDFPWGFGVGLDFDTRAGIFSISYALGKQFDNPFEIRTAKIHFGYISRF